MKIKIVVKKRFYNSRLVSNEILNNYTITIFSVRNIAFAQTTPNINNSQLDSLQKLLDTNTANDTLRIERLNDIARVFFYYQQFQKGFAAVSQALTLTKKLNYAKGEGLYYRTMTFLTYNYLYIYFHTKAKRIFEDIQQKEEIFYPVSPKDTKESIEKNNERLLADVSLVEKQKDKEFIAYYLYSIAENYFYLEKNIEGITYLNNAIENFNAIGKNSIAIILQFVKPYFLRQLNKTTEAEKVIDSIPLMISKVDDEQEAVILKYILGRFYISESKNAMAIENELQLNNLLEQKRDDNLRAEILADIAVNFQYLSMHQKAAEYYKTAIWLKKKINSNDDMVRLNFNLGFELVAVKKFDEAKEYFMKARDIAEKSNDSYIITYSKFRFLDGTGQILMGKGNYEVALKTFFEAEKIPEAAYVYTDFYIAQCYLKLNNLKESIRYGEKSYEHSLKEGDQGLVLKVCNLLYENYDRLKQTTQAYKYLKKYKEILDEREAQDIANRAANFEIQSLIERNQLQNNKLEKDKLQKEKENQNQRWWLISISGVLLSSIIILYILFRTNVNKQKANNLLLRQKEEISIQKNKAENTLTELKSTQAQLIQSEKMASLGELTAGIAHEIQNPLNFVNNFSEVNKEMLEEFKAERLKPNLERDEDLQTDLINDVIANEEKINHHGKRADAIVKGMLQHSRQTKGVKEPTDINALSDEYLLLSYHGLRAKDKNFNADFKTDFDESIGKINIVPQDIGRVLLNLFNNAFYATSERHKTEGESYKPHVTVETKKLHDKVEIAVKDNGNGIPQSIIDKIFQPFFTTKPTGQGTGLGLSLAYDIITKEHNGTIKVESKGGEGSIFAIQIPI